MKKLIALGLLCFSAGFTAAACLNVIRLMAIAFLALL